MNRRKPHRLMECLVVGLAGPTLAYGAAMTESEYSALRERAVADSEAARGQCALLADNAKDVCMAEAKAAERKTMAAAQAQYLDTDQARRAAAAVAAEADFDVAKEKCGAYPGSAKDSCIAAAKMKYLPN